MNNLSKIFILLLISLLIVIFIGISVCRNIVKKTENTLPNINELSIPKILGPTIFYDSNGNQVATFASKNNEPIDIKNVPLLVKNAFIAAEDKNFYNHDGLDYYGIIRAVIFNLEGKHISGASTITQQVIKNLVTGGERTMDRKIKEALLARRVEKILSKDEILDIYFNTIWLGAGAYGINTASQVWFQKNLNNLNPAEVAYLAALPKGPAIIDPKNHPERAKSRRLYVLNRMCEDGYLNCNEVNYWNQYPLPNPVINNNAGTANDWYEETVRRQFVNDYGYALLYSGGIKVKEYKNDKFQKLAQQALNDGIDNYMLRHKKENEKPNGSVIIMDSETGAVLAEVGGSNYESGFDRAIQSKRQIGSVAKAVITNTALHNGYDTNTDIMDVPIHLDDGYDNIWSPGADGGDGMGVISLKKALAASRNQAFVRISNDIGFDKIYDDFYKYGLYPDSTKLTPAATLGAIETTPLNVAVAYSRLINGGKMVNPEFIESITEKTGNIKENTNNDVEDLHDINDSNKIKDMLHQVVAKGTAYQPFHGMELDDIGGKTGTSNNVIDSWFAGYKGKYVVVVHIGFDMQKNMGNHEFGATIAAPIAAQIMKELP